MDEFWKPTYQMFSNLIDKPKMTEKLLSRPPFRYLFDIIMQTSKKTNFATELYFAQELEPNYYDNRQKKITFMQKIIKLVEMLSGKNLNANPSKIIAGLEPENTNLLLQEIYKLATDKEKIQIDIKPLLGQIFSQHKYKYEANQQFSQLSSFTKIIIFDTSKQQLGSPPSNFKKFVYKYKHQYKIGLNKESISFDNIKKVHLFIIAGPKQPFSPNQIQVLKKLIDNGERILIMANQGGDLKNNTNLNTFTSQYGIKINDDSITQTSFCKLFYPKNHQDYQYINVSHVNKQTQMVKQNNPKSYQIQGKYEEKSQIKIMTLGTDFMYQNGTFLQVKPPSYPLISSVSQNQLSHPIVAVHVAKSGGRLMVYGNLDMFDDNSFDCDENFNIMEFTMNFLLTNNINIQFSQVYQENNNIYVKAKHQEKDLKKGKKFQNTKKDENRNKDQKGKNDQNRYKMNSLEEKMEKVGFESQNDEVQNGKGQDFYERLSETGACDITIQILRSKEIKSFQAMKWLKEEDIAHWGIKLGQIIKIRKWFSQ